MRQARVRQARCAAAGGGRYGGGNVRQPGRREDATMLRSRGRPRTARSGRGRTRQGPAITAVTACALVAALGTAGCAASASAGQAPAVAAATAYVPLPVTPGLTAAYLVMRNNAAATDSLVAVRTSAGGRVSFRVPAGRNSGMRTVPAIVLPPHTTV